MAKFHSSFLLLLFLLTACTTPSPITTFTASPNPSPTPISTPTPNATTIITPPPLPRPSPCAPTNATAIALAPLPQPQPQPPSPPTANATTITPQQPPPLQQGLQVDHQEQLNNIIDALIAAGDFKGWANILSISADLSSFPLSATFFIPADDSFTPPPPTIDPLIVPYHIVPQRLSFADLRQFKLFSRLPTLLPAKSILITNNSFSNFTLDGTSLSYPDFYTNSAFAVHGIANPLNYSVYGDSAAAVTPSKPKALPPPALLLPPNFMAGDDDDDEELTIGRNRHPHHSEPEVDSDASCLCNNVVWTICLVVCTVLASKIRRMSAGLMDFLV